jgi:hypothetical protein
MPRNTPASSLIPAPRKSGESPITQLMWMFCLPSN